MHTISTKKKLLAVYRGAIPTGSIDDGILLRYKEGCKREGSI